jgi:hypothetical protein
VNAAGKWCWEQRRSTRAIDRAARHSELSN